MADILQDIERYLLSIGFEKLRDYLYIKTVMQKVSSVIINGKQIDQTKDIAIYIECIDGCWISGEDGAIEELVQCILTIDNLAYHEYLVYDLDDFISIFGSAIAN